MCPSSSRSEQGQIWMDTCPLNNGPSAPTPTVHIRFISSKMSYNDGKNKTSKYFKLGSVNHYAVWVAFSLMDLATKPI